MARIHICLSVCPYALYSVWTGRECDQRERVKRSVEGALWWRGGEFSVIFAL